MHSHGLALLSLSRLFILDGRDVKRVVLVAQAIVHELVAGGGFPFAIHNKLEGNMLDGLEVDLEHPALVIAFLGHVERRPLRPVPGDAHARAGPAVHEADVDHGARARRGTRRAGARAPQPHSEHGILLGDIKCTACINDYLCRHTIYSLPL